MTGDDDTAKQAERLKSLESRLQHAFAATLKGVVEGDPAWKRFEKTAGLASEDQNGMSFSDSAPPRPDGPDS